MSFLDFQNQVNEKRATSEALRNNLKEARQRASNIKRRKDELLREIGANAFDRGKRLKEINESTIKIAQSVDTGITGYTEALKKEWAVLKGFSQFTDPIKNIASLQDDCPILLFPLRLETRFKKVEQQGEVVDQLWVRVFPDDIAINSFESDLSATEIRNARSYWLTRWKAGRDDVDGNRAAWRSLASAHGPGRAYWLTKNFVPVNMADEPRRNAAEIILVIGTENKLAKLELGDICTYWQTVWQSDRDNEVIAQAWSNLLRDVGEEEASRLIKDYKPFNINDTPPVGFTREETLVRVEFVIFEKSDELDAKLHAWSQPPATSILPERFMFLAYQDGKQTVPQLSNLIPPKLILGPDPAADPGEDFRLVNKEDADADPNVDEGDLIFSENMQWMFDFDEAVAKGMGFKIDLSSEQVASGFDKVFVIGLKLSADKEQGQILLEELFAQHQNSRKGLGIIKQGTPTNNTEEDESGYSWRHDPDDSFNIYFDESAPKSDPTDWFNKCDGRWLAELLGIDPAKLQAIDNYYGTDITEAKAMQRALWPATMGHFMDSMMNPVFSANDIEQTRDFFTRYVSGRGNLPAIRVGKQPYGILPVTNYTGMKWFARQSDTHNRLSTTSIPDLDNIFLAKLYKILLDMDQVWMNLQRKVAYVGKKGDPHQILLDIVGLHPDSVELYKRYANSLKQIHNIYNAKGFKHDSLFSYYPTSYTDAASLLEKYGYIINNKNLEPDIFKKTFFDKAWILGGDRIDKVPNSEEVAISNYTPGENGKNYIGWLIESAEDSHNQLRQQDGFIDDKPPTALLYLLLYHSLDLSYIDTSLKLHLSNGVLTAKQVQQAYIEPDFIHIEENNETESRWKYLYKSDVRITGDPDIMLGRYIPQHIDTIDEAADFRDVLAGLKKLQDVPTARLERAMMEHIDTVSYRYDAWILGYLHLQLEHMRGLHSSDPDSPSKRGVYIGAYGWLEDLRSENKVLTPVNLSDEQLNEVFNKQGDLVEDADNAGYILAPSQNHAVTAAVLRNGHLSNDDPEDKEELKIKLSSERVRLALQIIEGIQGGQTLSALLGYQFERGLHDRTDAEVDAFIFELRNAFPLVAKKFKDTTPGVEDTEYESIDQIEAKNVMDGIAFLEYIEENGTKTYPFDLSLPLASEDQRSAINLEVSKLIEINDAVADLALAESVHQVVLGNYERASATLDTYSKGNFPPTPDVIKTPRSGTVLTHRVALQFKTNLSHNLEDPGVTPRMVAEPAIHDWLAQIMPGMDEIECVVRYFDRTTETDVETPVNLSHIGLAHIDVLYLLNVDSDQAMSALDDLIIHYVLTHHTPRMDKAINIDYTRKLNIDKFTVFEMTSLIASLRALLLRSKPLNAADVKLSNEAAKENEETLSLDPGRVERIVNALTGIIKTDPPLGKLTKYITHLVAIIAIGNVNDIVDELDSLMDDIAVIFVEVNDYGIPQAGIGFVYQWHQSMYKQLRAKVDELIERWGSHRSEYIVLNQEYLDGVGTLSDEELFAILRKAELKISSTSAAHLYATPADYCAAIDTKFVQFEVMLDDTLLPLLELHALKDLVPAIQTMAGQLPPFDISGIDIEEELKQIGIFANDLQNNAENLSQEIQNRTTQAGVFLASAAGTSDPLAKVELVKDAAKAIFGDDFVIIPEFTVDATQGTEWQNTLMDSDNGLRYLFTDLDMDFPMDDWLYGVSRVREKLYHVENTLLHIEGFNGTTLSLVPSQFPYREDDYWLGMQFPDKKPGTEDPFTIDEDKLLFTSIYPDVFDTSDFDPDQAQCGLLLDEWTEVIPSRDETPGLTFHYDQPNSEPSQTLLLATPSNFTGSWKWEDLVNTLHETLDMAKKRAVEPDHVDTEVYSRFLPPIVSLTSPLPLTATLNLALNNQVFFAKVFNND